MAEGGVLTAVAILFALISAYLPLLGAFVSLIWPVPIILLGARHGYKWSIMATVASGLLIAILMHPLHAVGVVIGFGLIGIVLGHSFRSGYSPVRAMIVGSAASLVSKVAVLGIGALVMGVNPLDAQTDALVQSVGQVTEIYRNLGMKEEDLEKLSTTMQEMMSVLKIILPAGFIAAAVFDTYLNFVVAKSVMKKLGHTVAPFPPFKHWNMPWVVLAGFLAALIMIYWGRTREISWLFEVGLNLQVLASIFLLVQGLALVFFLTDKYKVSKFVRGLILILVLSNGFLSQILILVGAVDIAIDYRRLRKIGTD
ncbi:MAG: Protein of unknown function rane [Firmicutes bacterium]|nr:Protein of unknown function rane [Bacillota bacterium]